MGQRDCVCFFVACIYFFGIFSSVHNLHETDRHCPPTITSRHDTVEQDIYSAGIYLKKTQMAQRAGVLRGEGTSSDCYAPCAPYCSKQTVSQAHNDIIFKVTPWHGRAVAKLQLWGHGDQI